MPYQIGKTYFKDDAEFDEHWNNSRGLTGAFGGQKAIDDWDRWANANLLQYKPSVIAAAKEKSDEEARRAEKAKILADKPGARKQTQATERRNAAVAETLSQMATPATDQAAYPFRLV